MRCAVVGSGVAGMTAALLLVRQGHDVALLEAGPRPAPLLRGFRRDGLHFDTGFHCGGGLGRAGLFRNWLQALGLLRYLPPTAFIAKEEVFSFPDGALHMLPAGRGAALEAAERQFLGSRSGMDALLRDMETVLDHSPYTNPRSADTVPSFAGGKAGSVLSRLDEADLPPRLAMMLAARCLLYGVTPARASWEDFSLVAGPYFHSCHALDGGGETLAGAFLAALAESGIRPRCGRRVVDLVLDGQGALRGVRVVGDDSPGGEVWSCTRCVFTGHPAQLRALLPPGVLRPAYYSHIDALPETPPGLLLFAETRSDALDGRNLYLLPGDAPERLFGTEDTPAFSVYLSVGQAAEGRRALLAVTTGRPELLPPGDPRPRPEAYLRWKRVAVARLKDFIERRCPDLRRSLRVLDAATGLSFRHWVRGSSGSLYGVCHDLESMPLLPVTRVGGLFLAGQNILLPGVLGALISAALAVGFAEGHENALREFRQCADNG